MAKALREAEFQEEEARASLDGANAEQSAHELLGAPQALPFVRRDEGDFDGSTAVGASSSSSARPGLAADALNSRVFQPRQNC